MKWGIVTLVWIGLLAGCATLPPSSPSTGDGVETVAGGWLSAGRRAAVRGDWARAESALEQAVRLAPSDPEIWWALADLREVQGRREQAMRLRARACYLSGRRKRYCRGGVGR